MNKKKSDLAKWFDAGDWWDWARRHPQTLAAAALLVAAMVALAPHGKKAGRAASETEEIPLFI